MTHMLVPVSVVVWLTVAWTSSSWVSWHFHFLWWSVGFLLIISLDKHTEGLSKPNLFPLISVLSSVIHLICIPTVLWQWKSPLYVLREQWSSILPSPGSSLSVTGEWKKTSCDFCDVSTNLLVKVTRQLTYVQVSTLKLLNWVLHCHKCKVEHHWEKAV